MSVFIIAEAGSSHDNDLQKAYRLIEAAKECGADAVKFQWTSNSYAMAVRRGVGQSAADMYGQYLQKPISWLESLKAYAKKVHIKFGCTVYLKEDIDVVAPLVDFFKVSAFESNWDEFVQAHMHRRQDVIVSINSMLEFSKHQPVIKLLGGVGELKLLYCVSKYPTALEDLHLDSVGEWCDGLSDHTANVLTGAAAVAAGARIVEAHIRLRDTDKGNPDYRHSLIAVPPMEIHYSEDEYSFRTYVQNIRTVERML